MTHTTHKTYPSYMLPPIHEAALWCALAAIPIGATLIHPLLGLACTLATLRAVYRLGNRSYPSYPSSSGLQPPASRL